MEYPPKSYALALLTLVEEVANEDDQPLLGMALDLNQEARSHKLAAHRLLQTLIEHSPYPEVVAQQFMTALAQCGNSAVVALGDAPFRSM
jgi:hypothetical protein